MRESVNEEVMEIFETAFNSLEDVGLEKCQSVGDYWNSKVDPVIIDSFEPDEGKLYLAQCVLNHKKLSMMCNEGAPRLKNVDISSYIAFSVVPENMGFVLFENGYKRVVAKILEDIPKGVIHKEHKVCSIHHKLDSGNRIQVSCKNGSKFLCDGVVVTVSPIVLKKMLTQDGCFSPPMPKQKLEALQSIELSNTVKLFFKFKTSYPNRKAQYIHFFPSNQSMLKSDFAYAYSVDRIGSSEWWLLWVNSNLVKALKRFKTPKEFLDNLFEYAHENYERFPNGLEVDVENIVMHDWENDSNYLGAYSRFEPSSKTLYEIIPELRKPVIFNSSVDAVSKEVDGVGNSQILLSGEITHDQFFSTTHAGFAVGIRDAKIVANFLLNS